MPASIQILNGKARLVIPSRGGIAAIGGSQVPGAFGEDGEDGREVQLQKSATHIQWRYVGEAAWTNLVALSELQGAPGNNGTNGTNGTNGQEVELQKSATHIQWRYVGAASWTNLVALSELQGEQGEQGEIGFPGFKYDARRIGADQYVIGEIIEYGGSYFVCLASNDAITPTGGALGVYWAAHSFGGGGAAITGTGIAYVRSGGNDTTGTIGNPSLPYLTAQAAWNAGARVFELGAGSFSVTHYSNVATTAEEKVFFRGVGKDRTNVSLNWYGEGGASGDAGGGGGGAGYKPSALLLGSDKSVLFNVLLEGGGGGTGGVGTPGTEETPGGNGGSGGQGSDAPNFTIFACALSSLTVQGGSGGTGGAGGSDGGAGGGSSGSSGTLGGSGDGGVFYWSDIPDTYTENPADVFYASLLGNDFTDSYVSAVADRAVTEHYMRTTDFTDSSGTVSNVTGLSCSVAENEKVLIEIVGFRAGGAAGSGLKISFSGPNSPTDVKYTLEHWNAVNTGRTVAAATSFNTVLTQADGSMEYLPVRVTLTLINGPNADTVQFRAASENSGTSINLLKGLTMRVHRIP